MEIAHQFVSTGAASVRARAPRRLRRGSKEFGRFGVSQDGVVFADRVRTPPPAPPAACGDVGAGGARAADLGRLLLMRAASHEGDVARAAVGGARRRDPGTAPASDPRALATTLAAAEPPADHAHPPELHGVPVQQLWVCDDCGRPVRYVLSEAARQPHVDAPDVAAIVAAMRGPLCAARCCKGCYEDMSVDDDARQPRRMSALMTALARARDMRAMLLLFSALHREATRTGADASRPFPVSAHWLRRAVMLHRRALEAQGTGSEWTTDVAQAFGGLLRAVMAIEAGGAPP